MRCLNYKQAHKWPTFSILDFASLETSLSAISNSYLSGDQIEEAPPCFNFTFQGAGERYFATLEMTLVSGI